MRRILPLLALAALCCGALLAGVAQPARAAGPASRSVGYGSDKGDCTANPCLTIDYAISQSSAGDTINVSSGTYSEMVMVTKSVSIIGASGATIDATGKTNGVLISGSSANGATVKGFMVQNAQHEGILATNTANVSVLGNTVQNNDKAFKPTNTPQPCGDTQDCGEGIHLMGVTNATVDGNTVQNNVGGILLTDETGPTAHNTISNNTSQNAHDACGIVLASHVFHLGSPIDAATGGVFDNMVNGNTVMNNKGDAAGIGLFTAAPGGATYANTVINNTISGNDLPGVTMHSHAPFQNLNDNVIVNNTISKNGSDADSGVSDTVGIIVFADVASGASPISSVTIQNNTVSNEKYGVYFNGTSKVFDTSSNAFDKTVGTNVGQKNIGAASGSAVGSSGSGSAPAVPPPVAAAVPPPAAAAPTGAAASAGGGAEASGDAGY